MYFTSNDILTVMLVEHSSSRPSRVAGTVVQLLGSAGGC